MVKRKSKINNLPTVKDWLDKREAKIILWDLDDTLIDTVTVFISQINKYLMAVSANFPDIPYKKLEERFQRTDEEYFSKYAVNSRRYSFVVEKLQQEFGGSIWVENLNLLNDIYHTLPSLHLGAKNVLEEISKLGVRQGIVTHANREWVDFKLKGLGIDKFFGDSVYLVDENVFKTADEWRKAIESFGVTPTEVVIFGDNVKGDIQATHKIGVKHRFWVDRAGGWWVYREGEIPEGTIVISKLEEFLEIVKKG